MKPHPRPIHLLPVLLGVLVASCAELPNLAPTASFVYSPVSPIFMGRTAVTFDATVSEDADGRIVQYTWGFGDGTPEVQAAGPVTSHVFPVRPGCFETVLTVQLTVTDDTGLRGFASQRVSVLPQPDSEECQPEEP